MMVFEDCPAFIIVISILSLNKKKGSHVLESSLSNGSILINIHELLTLIVLLISKRSFIRNPSNQKKLLYRMWNLHEGHHLWNLHEALSLLVLSTSSKQHVAWDMFSSSIIKSFILICKCVNNQSTKLGGINVPKY